MKPLKVGGLAALEFREAVRWYEERRPGWGSKLFDAIAHATDLVRAHPEIGEARKGRLPSRKLRVPGFPYYVVYRIREGDIYVVAIAHTSRRPGYWRDRR
ncbi:MAG: type II toxin-antitoxin system RelE/ParE family toxin [Acidobacteria bacterium]|nr:type II toxin-antitoxin system RelE/ParE family toxin [Acidobacteriota bacterium]